MCPVRSTTQPEPGFEHVQTDENFHEVIAQAREEDRKAMRAGEPPEEIAKKRPKRRSTCQEPTTRIAKRLREKSDKSQPECVDQPKRHHKSYVVKKILECRLNPEGQEMYLVWWEGYPKPTGMGASCWEPLTSFRSCPDLLAEFKASSSPSWQGETTGRS